MNVLLGVASSIAAYRALDLGSALRKRGHSVRYVLSENVPKLIAPAAFEAISGNAVATSVWGTAHDGAMEHLSITKWADSFALVPASANLLATVAHGAAADAIGTFCVSWNKRPLIVAPAMNPEMWRNAAVQANVATLRARGHRFIGPVEGDVACGDFGVGRLAPVDAIEHAIVEQLEGWDPLPDLSRERILITGGPTREFADDVRFLSNPSSGRQAMALAREALDAGAEVTLVCGPVEVAPPLGLKRFVPVTGAKEMLAAVREAQAEATALIFCAAVSDWRPAQRVPGKLKKEGTGETMHLELVRTPDIAHTVSQHRTAGQVFIGFAAEAVELEANADRKLHYKSFDLIFANPINERGAGFGTDTNHGVLIAKDGTRTPVPSWTKRRVARLLLSKIASLRG